MKITIDGRPLEFQGPKTVLEAARDAGIAIPHLCDHSRLKPFGACRMCLVEIKGRRGFPPSCSTMAEDGMVVETQTEELRSLRRGVLELILSEHPFACLICSEYVNCPDKKGTIRKVSEVTGCILCSNDTRCELQDTVKAVGVEKVNFPASYRNVDVRRDDPFFDRNYNLCILCGRCVRICDEVRGASALTHTSRGSRSLVGTAFDRPLTQSGCQFCGACVDVCPTGALVDRAARPDFVPDTWAGTVCPLCSNGCRLKVGLKNGAVVEIKPDEEGPSNHGQACLRGRFLARELASGRRRILKPRLRKGGELVECGWDEALEAAADKMKAAGAASALITSSQAGLEDLFVAYRFGLDVLGTANIAGLESLSGLEAFAAFTEKHRLGVGPTASLDEISRAQVLLVCGEELNVNQPMVWLRIHEALGRGAKLVLLNAQETALDRHAAATLRVRPGLSAEVLLAVIRRLLRTRKLKGAGLKALEASLNKVTKRVEKGTGVELEMIDLAAGILGAAKDPIFLFGPAFVRENASSGLAALWNLALILEARIVPTVEESGTTFEFELRRSLGREFLSLPEVLSAADKGRLKALYLTGPAPKVDRKRLESLIVQDAFWSENAEQADIVLPAATFFESEGSLMNREGLVQRYVPVIGPAGESKPDRMIFADLAARMGSKALDFGGPSGLTREAERIVVGKSGPKPASKFVPVPLASQRSKESGRPYRLVLSHSLDYYRSFDFSREVKGLRALRDADWIVIHPDTAASVGIKEGDAVTVEAESASVSGVAHLDRSVDPNTVRACLVPTRASSLGLWGSVPLAVTLRKG